MNEPKTPQQEQLGRWLAGCCLLVMGLCAVFALVSFTAPVIAVGVGAFWADLGSGVQWFLGLAGAGLAALGVGAGVGLARDRRALPPVTYVAVLPSARRVVDIERIDL